MKNEFKILKHIKPDNEKKERFRYVLLSRVKQYYDTTPHSARAFAVPRILPKFRVVPLVASLLVIALLSTGSGVVFASQNSLPGERLFPVKLTAEKVRVVLARNKEKKAQLHLEFAKKRLGEAKILIEQKKADLAPIQLVIEHYSEELEKSNKLLDKNGKPIIHIAALVDEATQRNQKVISAISKRLEQENTLRDILEDALDDTERKNDRASFVIITATTSAQNNTETKDAPRKKSRKKFEQAREKIEKIKRKIEKEREKDEKENEARAKSNEITALLKKADDMLKQAQEKSEEEQFEASLVQSIRARELAKEARKLQKELRKQKREEEKEAREREKERKHDRDEEEEDEDEDKDKHD